MVSIEQVRLLEARVIKTIEFVDQVTEENTLLKSKLDSCQKRIDELEVLIQRFKEDQVKIEDSIISALDRLNKFEDDMGKGLSNVKAESTVAVKYAAVQPPEHSSPEQSAHSEAVPSDGFVLKEMPYDPASTVESGQLSGELEIF
ncbi:MAG: cell division protein ZapB [Spirochaetaceae bacterium]|jgi:predicted nuclease with TOPRIM domain|nr:cell division protein ZapB [Spirochaetaceae bacterium]